VALYQALVANLQFPLRAKKYFCAQFARNVARSEFAFCDFNAQNRNSQCTIQQPKSPNEHAL